MPFIFERIFDEGRESGQVEILYHTHTLSVNVPDKNDIRLIFGVIQIIFDCFLYKIMLKRQFNYEAIL